MTVLVTGGSGGIGAQMCKNFASAGYKVAINYFKSETAAQELATEIIHEGGKAKAYKADISDPSAVKKMVLDVISDFGGVDVLINNAAVSMQGLLTDMTDKDYERIMGINVKGTFNVTRAVLPGMIRRKNGAIINISSMWGQTGASCEVIYSASKAAIIGFTKALAKEVGPSGIRVNCVAPGVIDTPMNVEHSEETMQQLADETPLCRIGTPKEIADTAMFLASDKASFVTGQIIGVNGGFVI